VVRDKWKMNVWAVVTGRGSLVRHLEKQSAAPLLFRTKAEAVRVALTIGMDSRPAKVEIRIRRLG